MQYDYLHRAIGRGMTGFAQPRRPKITARPAETRSAHSASPGTHHTFYHLHVAIIFIRLSPITYRIAYTHFADSHYLLDTTHGLDVTPTLEAA
jgi:hypothetical protein